MGKWMKILILIAAIVLAAVVSRFAINTASHGNHEHHGVIDEIYANHSYNDSAVSSVTHLADLDTHHVFVHDRSFYVPNRKDELTSFPCSNCHTVPLEDLKNTHPELGQKAHWEKEIKHAGQSVMNCQTCHGTDVSTLNSLTGEVIDFDESYKLCGQCHQTPYKDWAGGAHGKRVGGWAKPVIRKSCVNCHDPHSPTFESKMPVRHNTKMQEQRIPK